MAVLFWQERCNCFNSTPLAIVYDVLNLDGAGYAEANRNRDHEQAVDNADFEEDLDRDLESLEDNDGEDTINIDLSIVRSMDLFKFKLLTLECFLVFNPDSPRRLRRVVVWPTHLFMPKISYCPLFG